MKTESFYHAQAINNSIGDLSGLIHTAKSLADETYIKAEEGIKNKVTLILHDHEAKKLWANAMKQLSRAAELRMKALQKEFENLK